MKVNTLFLIEFILSFDSIEPQSRVEKLKSYRRTMLTKQSRARDIRRMVKRLRLEATGSSNNHAPESIAASGAAQLSGFCFESRLIVQRIILYVACINVITIENISVSLF